MRWPCGRGCFLFFFFPKKLNLINYIKGLQKTLLALEWIKKLSQEGHSPLYKNKRLRLPSIPGRPIGHLITLPIHMERLYTSKQSNAAQIWRITFLMDHGTCKMCFKVLIRIKWIRFHIYSPKSFSYNRLQSSHDYHNRLQSHTFPSPKTYIQQK